MNGRQNHPLINLFLGIILTLLGIFNIFVTPVPGAPLGGRMGQLKAPPRIFWRLFSAAFAGFGIYLIRESLTFKKE